MKPIEEEVLRKIFNDHGYKYENILGRGSYGFVYRVSQGTGPRTQEFAMKFLDTAERDKNDPQKYNRREIELLQTLPISEQNVVKYYKNWNMTVCGIDILCIKMELCWCNLEEFVYENDMGGAEIIKAQGPPRLYQQVFPQILEGIQAIHSIGWVHRDIHYQNILVAMPKPTKISEIQIKIADFGLAREIGSASQNKRLSPYDGGPFSAPELPTGDYDEKVDLYSAGVVLYFLSRYLEDRGQWTAEIIKFRNDAPFYDDLYFQDDNVLLNMIMSLIAKKYKDRPTAQEALTKMTTESLNAPLPIAETNSPIAGTNILVKKESEDCWKRCTVVEYTLSSLKDQIHNCIDVKPEHQALTQITYINVTGNNEPQRFEIKIDNDIQTKEMFLTPERKRFCIEVREKMDTSD